MTQRTTTGLEAIAAMFAASKAQGRASFLPFFTIGFPSFDQSLDAITAMAQAEVDGFEIGIPFSDPVADGPTIQEATQVALDNGMTVTGALNAVRILRERGVHQPMLMFSYLNPILNYGVEQFILDAKAAGADGFIIPDLPPEEAHLFDACKRENMALVFFIAPTSDAERIALVTEKATGFIYVLSLTGITGARAELPADLRAFIAGLREATSAPLVLGFGISTPDHARMMNGLMDGYIVGSALVRAAKAGGVDSVRDLAVSLRGAGA